MKKQKIIISLLILLCFILLSFLRKSEDKQLVTSTPTATIPETVPVTTESAQLVSARVVKIIDGDTIDVDLGSGNVKRLRYIGIDTPESVDPRKPVQCFSKEATEKNRELVENKMVRLEKDVSETDRYGRLLRYVYVEDMFVNEQLVSEGYAHAISYPPDVKHQEKFMLAEQKAREGNKGLWGRCE